jgi:hypothetical protein
LSGPQLETCNSQSLSASSASTDAVPYTYSSANQRPSNCSAYLSSPQSAARGPVARSSGTMRVQSARNSLFSGLSTSTEIPRRPPGLHTRASSEAAACGSYENITPCADSTQSNDAESKGNASASPSTKAIWSPASAAAARAVATIRGEMSSPVTQPPRAAARSASAPVPVATSRMRSDSVGATAAVRASWIAAAVAASAPKGAASQDAPIRSRPGGAITRSARPRPV